MSCNFCTTIKGLKKVDHPLNCSTAQAFGLHKVIQIYRCQLCQEYLMYRNKKHPTIAMGAFGYKSPAKEIENITHVGYDPTKIKDDE